MKKRIQGAFFLVSNLSTSTGLPEVVRSNQSLMLSFCGYKQGGTGKKAAAPKKK